MAPEERRPTNPYPDLGGDTSVLHRVWERAAAAIEAWARAEGEQAERETISREVVRALAGTDLNGLSLEQMKTLGDIIALRSVAKEGEK